jgi:hypothetical protein
MIVADVVKQIEAALNRNDRRNVALLATELDDAVLLCGDYDGAFPMLIDVLRSRAFRTSAAAWQVLRAIEGNANLLTLEEQATLAPLAHELLLEAEDELTRRMAHELYVAVT